MSAPGRSGVLLDEPVTGVEPTRSGAPDPAVPGGRVAGVLISLIRGYQLARSGRPTGCRFVPTCSEYAAEAIRSHGALRGGAISARRLARCNPWGGQGYDPVPDGKVPCTHH